MKYEFKSSFAEYMRNNLEQRIIWGYDVEDYKRKLASFDRFCLENEAGKATLSKELAFAWCNDAKGNGGSNRAQALRIFGRYLLESRVDAYIIPPLFFTAKKADPPFIFTEQELTRFFKATDHYPEKPTDLLQEYTVPVIFRLQYACGLRPKEVRCLRRMDFNFADGTIYIAKGKHYKDRKLAVDSSIMDLCRKYDDICEMSNSARIWFFQSPSGTHYSRQWLSKKFRECWIISGNDCNRGSCVAYDLRHNYATQILMRWTEEGRDLTAMIPYLSAYMGHADFSSTFYYIHLLPERLSKMDFMHIDGVIPEVTNEEDR